MSNEQNDSNNGGEQKPVNWWLLAGASLDFAFYILIPLLIAVYVGNKLDGEAGSKIYTVLFILLALAVSSYLIYRKIKDISDTLKRK